MSDFVDVTLVHIVVHAGAGGPARAYVDRGAGDVPVGDRHRGHGGLLAVVQIVVEGDIGRTVRIDEMDVGDVLPVSQSSGGVALLRRVEAADVDRDRIARPMARRRALVTGPG